MDDTFFEHAGLKCKVVYRDRFRCGYVGIDERHPLHGKDYNDYIPSRATADREFDLSDRGSAPVMAALTVDPEKSDAGMWPISLALVAHGGITFASTFDHDKELWWFGFDCGHAGDTAENCPPEYVKAQTKRLAEQLAGI